MSPTVLPSAKPQKGLTGRGVLIAIVAFFGTIFAVNGAMIFLAIKTHSGLVANEPYRKGLHYNKRIEADERQKLLGWTEAVSAAPSGEVAIEFKARDGAPVRALRLSGVIGRPAEARDDRPLTFTEATPGRYVAQSPPLADGTWLISIEARRSETGHPAADAVVYKSRSRVCLKC